jgi:hypothetical protein
MKNFLSVFVTAMMLSSTVEANTIYISEDYGGYVVDYHHRKVEWKRSNTRVEFHGNCESACTIYLGLPKKRLCMTENARFGFHKPFIEGEHDPNILKQSERYLLSQYPKWVQKWIKLVGGLKQHIVYMPNSIIEKHIKRC